MKITNVGQHQNDVLEDAATVLESMEAAGLLDRDHGVYACEVLMAATATACTRYACVHGHPSAAQELLSTLTRTVGSSVLLALQNGLKRREGAARDSHEPSAPN